MDSTEEKILRKIEKKVENEKRSFTLSGGYNLILWFSIASVFLLIFEYIREGDTESTISVVFAVLIGIFIGVTTTIKSGELVWPILRQYIDLAKLKKKLSSKKI